MQCLSRSEIKLDSIAEYFLADHLLDEETLKEALIQANKQEISLMLYLSKNKLLSSETMLACLSNHFAMPVAQKENVDVLYLENSVIKPDIMCRYRVLPLHHDEQNLYLGVTNPVNQEGISAIAFQTGLKIHCQLIAELDFENILTSWLRSRRLDHQLESTLLKITPIEENTEEHSEKEDDGPISEFVNRLFHDALEQQVSDIHIETYAENCRIRFRRDGLLHEAAAIPLHLAGRIIMRLKILSKLNIAERRLPQDGRLQLPDFPDGDIRVNTCPVMHGEKMVLRILKANHVTMSLSQLGMNEQQQKCFEIILNQPQGLILVTGPTGSGKTLTLYAALQYLNQIQKNISTVEDPVEIKLPGINQVNVNTRIGLDFPLVLRTLLRQDPDIIMVGEIRDLATAEIAVHASQTGHLVLSTLHTNSAIETIARLQAMGVAPWQFVDALSLIIAQRLVRKLCEYCKENSIPGCENCYQGYRGRSGIFELLPKTEKIAELIRQNASVSSMQEWFRKEKIITLQESAQEKIQSGITNQIEIKRVLGSHEIF